MMEICGKLDCTGCAACAQTCPKQAIAMRKDAEGFEYPLVDETLCVSCGLCRKQCPSLRDVPRNKPDFYYGWNSDEKEIRDSSSGGIFSALAHYVLSRGGIVFGAVLNSETHEVSHGFISRIEELHCLRKSKYLQSSIGKAYLAARDFLKKGRWVLFSGTACQIVGLHSLLHDVDAGRLLTVDVLCHGVASKKTVDAFLADKEKEFGKTISAFHFRVKEGDKGWQCGNGTRMHLCFSDGTSAVARNGYDTFFLGFNSNYFLRESCYRCRYCGTERISDFTLADYWNCREIGISSRQRWFGISAILLNTEKSRKVFKEIAKTIVCREACKEDVIAGNTALRHSQHRPELRDSFFKKMEERGYDSVIKHQFKYRFIKYKIKVFLESCLPRSIARSFFKGLGKLFPWIRGL